MIAPTFTDWRETGQRFAYRGQPIFWQSGGDGGDGDVLLCIHGFPSASWDWHKIWPGLCARFARVIAADMIGFGWSAKPRNYPYSIFDQADLHEILLREQGVRRFHILAHDYGDTVAQELLARHQERRARGDASLVIESICLLNGGLFPETHRPRLVQKLLLTPFGALIAAAMNPRSFSRSFTAVFGPQTQPSAQELQQFWQLLEYNGGSRLMHRLIHYIPERRANRPRWVGALQTTQVPLCTINGPLDPVSGAHMVERYRELVPNADVVSLPGIGHYPQVEAAAAVLQAYLDFLTRCAAHA
ncbi:MAG: alpha/beta hydrolase [Nevskia sp.]|nr:alpha/beta hydrolase [Nevskia sp.]